MSAVTEQRAEVLTALSERVAQTFGVPAEALRAPSATRNGGRGAGDAQVARARQAACYLAHRHLHVPQVELAAFFNRDHTSVSHGIARVERLVRADEEFRLLVFTAAGSPAHGAPTTLLEQSRHELEAARQVVRRLEQVVTRLERVAGEALVRRSA